MAEMAIRSRDGEEEIALLLSFRMHGFHVALPRRDVMTLEVFTFPTSVDRLHPHLKISIT